MLIWSWLVLLCIITFNIVTVTEVLVNIGSGDGILPDDTKPLLL